jgi:hypothetical protein
LQADPDLRNVYNIETSGPDSKCLEQSIEEFIAWSQFGDFGVPNLEKKVSSLLAED